MLVAKLHAYSRFRAHIRVHYSANELALGMGRDIWAAPYTGVSSVSQSAWWRVATVDRLSPCCCTPVLIQHDAVMSASNALVQAHVGFSEEVAPIPHNRAAPLALIGIGAAMCLR